MTTTSMLRAANAGNGVGQYAAAAILQAVFLEVQLDFIPDAAGRLQHPAIKLADLRYVITDLAG